MYTSEDYSIIWNTDSYKGSHWLQYPPETRGLYLYGGTRGGPYSQSTLIGLKPLLETYFKPVTLELVEEAREFWNAHMGVFNYEGWKYIAKLGYLPLSINAIPEGTLVPTGRAIFTVESTDNNVPWLASWVEASMLRLWYPSTVAILDREIKILLKTYWKKTSDAPEDTIDFKLHDFGARGSSSWESSGLAGLAHLANFRGTDTITAIRLARKFYDERMAGFSIPAAEHTTITSWGKPKEVEAFRNMMAQFANADPSFVAYAVVSDSYDLWNAVENLWGEVLRNDVINSKAMLVIRPDSGEPVDVVKRTLLTLESKFGTKTNSKGFKVLNNVRIIQGDGVNYTSIKAILDMMVSIGFSIDNIAFGMGGALHTGVVRDTQKWAMKCSAINVGGVWRDVYKDPVTDPGKASLKGRIGLYRDRFGNFINESIVAHSPGENIMQPAFFNGSIIINDPLSSIRERMAA